MSKLSNYLKNKSLTFQIWIVFSSAMLLILIIVMTIVTFSFKSFLFSNAYTILEGAQKNNVIIKNSQVVVKNNNPQGIIHYIVYPGVSSKSIESIFNNEVDSNKFWNNVLSEYNSQMSGSRGYNYRSKGEENIFYVITKYEFKDKKGFVVSYTKDSFTNNFYIRLTRRLILILIITSLLMLLAARSLAGFLSRPIKLLKNNVEKIGLRDWNMPINIDRRDEIGELSRSIEYMRQQLVKRDEAQQWMLQNISHELKTPVMVIRSYAQSVGDGIFPKGNLSSTMQVIDSEAERLDKRIKDLLYLTKLEYMLQHKKSNETINIQELIEDIVERFRIRKKGINWDINLHNSIFEGDYEQLNIAFENILENSTRYCRELIKITLVEEENAILIKIYNDGEHVEENMLDEIFKPFQKGSKGKFGLGLAIVKQIIEAHNGFIWVKNEQIGVTFYIKLVKNENHAV